MADESGRMIKKTYRVLATPKKKAVNVNTSNFCLVNMTNVKKVKSIRYPRKSAGVDSSQKKFCQRSIFIHFSRNELTLIDHLTF
jgi:hypothetical protein